MSLASKFCAVVRTIDKSVEFAGRHDECINYMQNNFNRVRTEEIDLYSAVKADHGLIEIKHQLSFVLYA